jgi:deoxyribonuclease V
VWPRTADELAAAQRELAAAAPPAWRPPAATIGACAVCFDPDDRAFAAAVVLRGRRLVADAVVTGAADAPYAAGLLALREGPLLEAAVRALAAVPDVLLVDATGRDHPRGAGMALHLGAVLDLPTVGVTHRPLLAAGDAPGDARGAASPLTLGGEVVGAWVRTRAGARPLAVHAAWRTSPEAAVAVAMAAVRRHRTPEPVRRARRLARLARAAATRAR